MEGLSKEVYEGKEIVVIDYSIVPHEKEFDLMKHSLKVVTEYEPYHALVLEVIVGVKLEKKILEYFPSYFAKIRGHVYKWASVGFGRLIFKEMIDSKQIDPSTINKKRIDWFETKEEAVEFLIKPN